MSKLLLLFQAYISLLVVDYALKDHFNILLDFYLMQDGFFFGMFLELTNKIWQSKPALQSETELMMMFHEAASKSHRYNKSIEDPNSLFRKLKMIIQPSSENSTAPSVALSWSNVVLVYEPSWPTTLLIDPPNLAMYQEIFSFLFQVRRVQIELQKVWREA